MKEKDLLFLKNPLDVHDHNIGLVYKKIKTNYFELLLCSTDYSSITQEDLIIPTTHSDLRYSVVVNTDILFPLASGDKNIIKKMGTLTQDAIDQIASHRGDIPRSSLLKVSFEMGSPIFYKSDKRYSMKIKNLKITDYYSNDTFEKLLFEIPNTVVSFIEFKAEQSLFDAMYDQKSNQKVELAGRQLLALVDRKLDINKYFYEVEENEIIFSNLDIKQLEKDILKELVAA